MHSEFPHINDCLSRNLSAQTFTYVYLWVSSFNLPLCIPSWDCQLQRAKISAPKGNTSEQLTAVAEVAEPTRIKTKLILLEIRANLSKFAVQGRKSIATRQRPVESARLAPATNRTRMHRITA